MAGGLPFSAMIFAKAVWAAFIFTGCAFQPCQEAQAAPSGAETPPALAFAGDLGKGRATLRLWPDYFFALRLESAKFRRDITGLWRQSADGVALELYNAQDLSLKLTRGKKKLYVSFGDLGWGSGEMAPVEAPDDSFEISGALARDAGGGLTLADAASGRVFGAEGASGLPPLERGAALFVTALARQGRVERIISHSRRFPRMGAGKAASIPENDGPGQETDRPEKKFQKLVAGRYWLLPPLQGIERAAMLFTVAEENHDAATGRGKSKNRKKPAGESMAGLVEISGPGLRCEGRFSLNGARLTVAFDDGTLKNLKVLGAESLARDICGEFAWSLEAGMLVLSNGRVLRLLGN